MWGNPLERLIQHLRIIIRADLLRGFADVRGALFVGKDGFLRWHGGDYSRCVIAKIGPPKSMTRSVREKPSEVRDDCSNYCCDGGTNSRDCGYPSSSICTQGRSHL